MFEALAKHGPSTQSVFEDLGGLVEEMQRGNDRALESLYDATVAKLFALASAILRNTADAEDAVCATYAQAWESAASFDRRRGNVLAWLLMICRSRALDLLRRRRASRDVLESGDFPAEVSAEQPEDLLSLVQRDSRVHAAIATLPPERRQLIALAFLRDLTHEEITVVTGLPLGTVKSHLRRALMQLREHLEIAP